MGQTTVALAVKALGGKHPHGASCLYHAAFSDGAAVAVGGVKKKIEECGAWELKQRPSECCFVSVTVSRLQP